MDFSGNSLGWFEWGVKRAAAYFVNELTGDKGEIVKCICMFFILFNAN